jgi:hypothetical protein
MGRIPLLLVGCAAGSLLHTWATASTYVGIHCVQWTDIQAARCVPPLLQVPTLMLHMKCGNATGGLRLCYLRSKVLLPCFGSFLCGWWRFATYLNCFCFNHYVVLLQYYNFFGTMVSMRVFYEVGFATIVFFSIDVSDDVFGQVIFSYNRTFFLLHDLW